MVSDEILRRKRVFVGVYSVLCLVGAIAITILSPENQGFQGALLRVGILLAAFWLAMPTKDRPAAWNILSSNWLLVGSAIAAAAIPRLRAMFPVIAVFAGIAWFARPRRNDAQGRS